MSRKLAKINKFENIKLKLKANTEKKSPAIWRMRNTSPLNKDEVIKHIDKTGVERVLDKKAAYGEHGLKDRLNRDKNLKKDIISALNSITKTAPKKGEENLINAISQNGYYMVFDGDRLVTAYKRENLERYFNKNSVTLKQEIIKRWWQK